MNPQVVDIWRAGVQAVGGFQSVATALSANSIASPNQIIAVGKAASEMTNAALEHFGSIPALVVTKTGHAKPFPETVTVLEASHPVPDTRSLKAGRALRECVASMSPDSSLLLLVSGGASALAEDLVDGQSLTGLQELNQKLLATGLDITAMNAERRKISRIKGGGLLGHFKGRAVQVLAISDVPGDDLAVIGSGIGMPPKSPPFEFDARIVASNTLARDAAEHVARSLGYTVLMKEEALHGDLQELVQSLGPHIARMPRGAIILGGEPTVVLPDNPGRGGRNQALALALSRSIAGLTDISIIVGGTDGSDGPTDATGGLVDGSTWTDNADVALSRADSGTFLETSGALFKTGPTGTNVMDLMIVLRD